MYIHTKNINTLILVNLWIQKSFSLAKSIPKFYLDQLIVLGGDISLLKYLKGKFYIWDVLILLNLIVCS